LIAAAMVVACTLITPMEGYTGGGIPDSEPYDVLGEPSLVDGPSPDVSNADESTDGSLAEAFDEQPDSTSEDSNTVVSETLETAVDESSMDDTGGEEPAVRGPLVAWLMDEGQGQIAADSSGNAYALTLGTSNTAEALDPGWSTDSAVVCGGAGLVFDGIDDVATGPDAPALNALTAFTLTFCIAPNSVGANSYGRIVSKEITVMSDVYVSLNPGTTSDQFSVGIGLFNTAGASFETDSQHYRIQGVRTCWAITYDDAGSDRTPRIYIDGVEGPYADHAATQGTLLTTSSRWLVGNLATADRPFDGVIDNVRIYDYVLPTFAIVALAEECTP
jgi:hypothetical protein